MKRLVTVSPWPMHPKVAEVLEAIPGITLQEALPGGPGPVLAIGKPPTFACDAIVVKSPEKAVQAVDIITGNGIEFVGMADILGRSFQKPVVELEPEKVAPKVSFK